MKNIVLIISFIGFFINIYAQETDYHWFEKDGKLYYNRNVPVYFWVSTSQSDNSQDVLMTSQTSEKYTNPMYFDSEGYNTFQYAYAVDTTTKKIAYPSQHAVFKVYVDGFAPTLNAYFKGTRRYYKGGTPVYALNLEIQLSAKDYMSGVEKIMYALNSENYMIYNEAIKFPNAGDFELKFYAEDNTGNRSEIKSYKFSVK
ncbi:MAG: hypothetical protein JXL97_12650 [Bacteroidales bacterium]|nr:hypothetical protein [Bacteroidales bacterium]